MLFYYVLLLIIGVDFLLEHIYIKRQDIILNVKLKTILDFAFKYRILTIFAFVFMSTFKADIVGCDTKTYIEWFYIENYRSDLGYSILQLIVFRTGLPYQGLWFVISAFVSFVLVLFINRFSENKLMSFILYVALGVFSQSMSFMRQIIALAFLLLELIAIDKKQWKLSYLYIFLAFLFHRTGLIGIVLLLLRFVKLNWKTIAFAFSLSIVIPLLFPYVSMFIDKLGFPSYYQKYFVSNTSFIRESSLVAKLYGVALFVIFLVSYIFIRHIRKIKEDSSPNLYFMLKIFMFAPLFKFIGVILNANSLFDRLIVYFFPMLIIIIPNLLKQIKEKRKLYYGASIACYVIALVFMHVLLSINYYEAFPFIFGF